MGIQNLSAHMSSTISQDSIVITELGKTLRSPDTVQCMLDAKQESLASVGTDLDRDISQPCHLDYADTQPALITICCKCD